MLKKWTQEEKELLITIYEFTPKKEILKQINRSWSTIRKKAIDLNVKRSKEVIKQDNIDGTKEAMLKKYGVEYSTLLPSMKEKSRQTNLKRRGVEYPSQNKEVQEKIKKAVRDRYGVDNVFQSEKIKKTIK